MISSAKILLSQGASNILIKGGHEKTKTLHDVFINKKEIKIFKNKKIKTKKHSWHRMHFI